MSEVNEMLGFHYDIYPLPHYATAGFMGQEGRVDMGHQQAALAALAT